jgi:hypothetical protein
VHRDDPREEVWESTTVAALDATIRRSDHLRFSLGLVARYHVAALAHAVPDARAERYEFDVTPSAGYVDASLAPGLHVRVGYQPVHLGRFDVFSATNVLSVNDLRDGPATLPEVGEVGQLAALCDYDVSDWLSVRGIYIPFFMPHIVDVTEGDYALFHTTQANVDNLLSDPGGLLPTGQLRAFVASNLSRADRERIASSGLAAFAPPPNLAHPQAAIRATAHGSAGELALTVSTALEHLPAFRVSNASLATLGSATGTSQPMAASTTPDLHPVSVEYNRFAVFSADAAIDVAPFSIGVELAYMMHRTLYAIGTAYTGPYTIPLPNFTDLTHVAARIEYVQNTHFLFALEAFFEYALALPGDPQRAWMFLEQGRFTRGFGGLLGYNTDFGLRAEFSGALLSGPSAVLAPRVSYTVMNGLDVEVGALFVEGKTPPPFATPDVSLGGLFKQIDYVFLGVRYQP